MRRSVLLASFVLALAQAMPAQDVGARVDEIFEDLQICTVDEIWELSDELERLGPTVVIHLKRGLISPQPPVRLASSKTLLSMKQERDLAVRALIALLNPNDDAPNEVRLASCELLYLHAEQSDVAPIKGYIDLVHDPYVKISMAKVLRKRGRDRNAVRYLKEYLASDNFDVRATAALALAEVGNAETAKAILERLAVEPTARGALARNYLEMESLLSSMRPTDTLDQQAQITALKQIIDGLETENKKLKSENRMGGGGEGAEAGGGEFPILSEVLKKIELFYVTDEEKVLERERLVDAALKGMVSSLDPFSSYMTEQEWAQFLTGMNQHYAGIGAYVNKDPRDGYLVISRPFYGGPAFKAGLRSLDKITEVEGASTSGMGTDEIISKLKGKPGTDVKIKVYRRGWDEAQEFVLKRADIEVPSVHYEMLPGSVGYIALTQFGQEAQAEVARALDDLERKGMLGLVFDLRNNGGGYLKAAQDICDFFLPAEKVVCFSQGRNTLVAPYTEHKTKRPARPDYPIVILVNGASASASEIVSGCLKDHGRAILVGEKTFGKGSVQQLFELDSTGGRLRLTIAKYYLPSGVSIHEKGVDPHVTVDSENDPFWKREALSKIVTELEHYAFDHFAKNRELFHRLVFFDNYDPNAWPEFEAFYLALKTDLSRDDVRAAVRAQARRLVQDDLAKLLPTDLQSDQQLQRAIYELLTRNGLATVPEYERFMTEIKGALEKTSSSGSGQ